MIFNMGCYTYLFADLSQTTDGKGNNLGRIFTKEVIESNFEIIGKVKEVYNDLDKLKIFFKIKYIPPFENQTELEYYQNQFLAICLSQKYIMNDNHTIYLSKI